MITLKSVKVWPSKLVKTMANPVFRRYVGMSTSIKANVYPPFLMRVGGREGNRASSVPLSYLFRHIYSCYSLQLLGCGTCRQ